jgi:hypothetical protein
MYRDLSFFRSKAMAIGFAALSTARDFADGLENFLHLGPDGDPEVSIFSSSLCSSLRVCVCV